MVIRLNLRDYKCHTRAMHLAHYHLYGEMAFK